MLGDYSLLTLPALLSIAWLFRFVGCTSTATGSVDIVFTLNMDPDLQKPVSGDTRQVKNIAVFWSIWNGGSLLRTVPVPPTVINPKNPDFLDPTGDQGAEYITKVSDLISADRISCSCTLTLGVPTGGAPDESEKIQSTSMLIDPTHFKYVFTLAPKPPNTPGAKRGFVLREYSV